MHSYIRQVSGAHRVKRSRSVASLAFVAALAVVGLGAAGNARAAVLVVPGFLDASDPTYNRPSSLSAVSGVGNNVYYDITRFTINVSEPVTIAMDGSLTDGDGHASLYNGPFNPASPLTNLLAVDDDSGLGFYPAFINRALTAGVQYTLITTTFSNGVTGAQNITFQTNAATVTVTQFPTLAIPEPASLGVIASVAALATARRRRTTA